MRSFNKTTVGLSVSLLVLALAAPIIDAKDSSMASVLSIDNSLLVPPKGLRSLQDGNVTDVTVESDVVVKEEDDHDNEEEEIAAMEAMCQCTGGSITCSKSDFLNHCHCHDGDVHCEADDDHDDGHGDHSDEDKPWGTVIGASFIINVTTLSGIFLVGGHWFRNFLCPTWNPDKAVGRLWANVIIPMFACVSSILAVVGSGVLGCALSIFFGVWNCSEYSSRQLTTFLSIYSIPLVFYVSISQGTLLATTFFLLLPEALVMIASEFSGDHDDHGHRMLEEHDDHDDHGIEPAATWRWGASIMGGFLFPVALHAFFPNNHPVEHSHTHEEEESAEKAPAPVEESADPEAGADDAGSVEKPISDKTEEASDADKSDDDGYVTLCGCLRLKNLSLFISMNLGEMLHNFTDGIFVGAAYIGCGPALGNSVVLATVLHEIPNQLAGYLVMVNQNGIDPIVALGLNFLFGLSVLVGALVVLSLDIGNNAIGCIFAIGGGVFLHVAISEMLGTSERNVMRKQHWLWVLLSFVVGAIVIGLVLINHEHCGGH